jgi:hypothetical protein
MPVLRLERTIWGTERTVLLFVSERLRQGQIRGLLQHLNKRIQALEQWRNQLAKPRSGPRTLAGKWVALSDHPIGTLPQQIGELVPNRWFRE